MKAVSRDTPVHGRGKRGGQGEGGLEGGREKGGSVCSVYLALVSSSSGSCAPGFWSCPCSFEDVLILKLGIGGFD